MARDIATSMAREMDRMLDSFLSPYTGRMPRVDIKSDEKEYTVKANVAGYDKDSISVFVDDHVLHIKGEEKKESKDVEKRKYILKERYVSSFERSFSLPEDADEDSLEASCRKGILTITVPRKAKEEAKKIEVKIGR